MLKNRLLAIGVMLYTASVALYVFTESAVLPLCFAVTTAVVSAILTLKILKPKTAVIFSVIPIIAVSYCLIYESLFLGNTYSVTGSITGCVTDVSLGFSSASVTVDVKNTDNDLLQSETVRVYTDSENITVGDAVTVSGKFISSKSKPYLLSDRIKYYSYSDVTKVGHTTGITASVRNKFASLFDSSFNGNISAFLKAITVGDKSSLTKIEYNIYSASGAAHLLAVSGLHLSVIVFSLYSLLKRILKNKKLVAAITVVAALCFTFITGGSLSTVRAAIMAIIVVISQAFNRRPDAMTSLFTALGLILIANPFAVASVSLELSFLSTLGIICFATAFGKREKENLPFLKRIVSYFKSPIIFSVSAFIFTLPVALFRFDRLALLSPITSVIGGLIFPLILVLSYIFCLLALISPVIAFPLTGIIDFLVSLFREICSWISSFRFSSLSSYADGFEIACALCILAIIVFLFISRKKRFVTAIVSAVSVVMSVIIIFAANTIKRSNTYTVSVGDDFIFAVSGNDTFACDFGSDFTNDITVYKSGATNCETLILKTIDSLSLDKVIYYKSVFGTRTVVLPTAESDEESFIYDRIEDYALKNDMTIKCDEFFTSKINDGYIRISDDGYEITAYGYRIDESVTESDTVYEITRRGVTADGN